MWISLLLWLVSRATSLPFITTWSTNTSNEAIAWPTISAQSLVTIDWGDNTPNSTIDALTNVTGLSHVYAAAGLHNVSVFGEFRWTSPTGSPATKTKLVDIVSWGDGFLVDANSASKLFYYYSNLRVSASPFTQPVFLPGANLNNMFFATSFDSPLNWDLLNVTIVTGIFQQTPLNKPINFSNTQGLLQCASMFSNTPNFNQPFTMDIPNVTLATMMFGYATSFNQPMTLTNSQNLTSINGMFSGASSFNQPFTLDTRAVTDMAYMFSGAVKFNQPLTFDTSKVTSMPSMFQGASSFNQTLNFSSTAIVRLMQSMFQNAPLFEQDLASWNTSRVNRCDNFCPRCGLPAFLQCVDNPCGVATYTNERNMSVCYSRAPTSSAPTSTPSSSAPTNVPTSSPTRAPTSSPTNVPTSTPTNVPSSSAPSTHAPTLAPSADLSTVSPAEKPSVRAGLLGLWFVVVVSV